MWKKPVRVTNNQKTPSLTSKTKSGLSSSTSNDIITQNTEHINKDDTKVTTLLEEGITNYEIAKDNINTLYSIENIQKTNKNRFSFPNLSSQRALKDTNNRVRTY